MPFKKPTDGGVFPVNIRENTGKIVRPSLTNAAQGGSLQQSHQRPPQLLDSAGMVGKARHASLGYFRSNVIRSALTPHTENLSKWERGKPAQINAAQ
jgi:hypothetical protein